MRLAIFGGTFDPIHKAHILMAREAADRFALDRVLFVPASHPPHKSGAHAPFEDRLRMVQLAIAGETRFEASRVEEGDAPSYSAITVEKLRAALKLDDELFFLIGADAFAEIETWYRWRDMVSAVTFIVVSRPGHQYRIPEGVRLERLETFNLPVSSSEIREALAARQHPADIPEPVLEYIFERGLYADKSCNSKTQPRV